MRHSASRIIIATPRAIFRAFLDAEVLVKWRAPAGMTARLHAFDPREGGGYRMELVYADPTCAMPKSSATSDIVRARFLELLPDQRLVEAVEFEGTDPAFEGRMTLTTTLTPVNGGTKVMIVADDVPAGIDEADHRAGMESSLKNLAGLLE